MIRLFIHGLRARWFEYALGALLIALPVAALTAYRSLSSVSSERVHALAHDLGKNMLVVPASTDLAERHAKRFGDVTMPADYPARIQASLLSRHVRSLEAKLHGTARVGDGSILVIGQRSFGRGSPDSGRVVVGSTAGKRLGVRTGDAVTVGGETLRVSAIAPPDGSERDDAVLVPLERAQRILGRPDAIDTMRLAGCWCRVDVPTLGKQVEALLPGTRAITLAGMLQAQKGTVAAVQRHGAALYAVAAALIGAIAIVVVSSQVRRQAREIGLLSAIGARPSFIMGMYLVRAAMMGAAGAALGYVIGFPLTSELGTRWMGMPVPVAEESLGVLVAISVVASVSAAFSPALRAVRKDPTEVLNEV